MSFKPLRPRITLVAMLLLASMNCGIAEGISGGRVCTLDFRYGLAVFVKDSVTGAWAASGARMFSESGGVMVDQGNAYNNAFPAGRPDLDSLPLSGAGERPGTYRVTVRKPGYADWVRSNVRVTGDECHVRLTTLTALLQPQR